MNLVFGFIGTLTAMVAIFITVGMAVGYTPISINFSGPESVG